MTEPDNPHDGAKRAHYGGSIEATLAGHAELDVMAVIREAWNHTDGIKGILIGGMLFMYLVVVVVSLALGTIFGVEEQTLVASTVSQLVMMMIVYPFMAGVFILGLKRSVGLPVRFQDQFSYYGYMLPIVAVGALQSLVTGIGLLLLIVPGIYLTFALCLAVPLKAERDLPITDCLLVSLKLVNRKFLEVVVLTLAATVLLVLGFLSLIGWIWTVPWTVMIFAIIYRQLAGFAPIQDGGGSAGPPRDTVEF